MLVTSLALTSGLFMLPKAHAQDSIELRMGCQKSASLFVLQKAPGTLEKHLALHACVK